MKAALTVDKFDGVEVRKCIDDCKIYTDLNCEICRAVAFL